MSMSGRVSILLVWTFLSMSTRQVLAEDGVPPSYPCPPTVSSMGPGLPAAGMVRDSYSPFYQSRPLGPDGIVTDRFPEDVGGLYGESPLDAYLSQIVKDSWVRLEYLSWTYQRPGETILGSPIQGVRDPRVDFPVTVGVTQVGFAHVENLGSLNLRDEQGLRATLGIPTNTGTFEANIFSFQEGRTGMEEVINPPAVGQPVGVTLFDFIATSTYTNGQVGPNLFLYDESFRANFTSDFWGAEANFVFDPLTPGPGFNVRSLFGFRFVDLQERLSQVGVFDQNGFLQTPQISTIDSIAKNRVYAPQIGLRAEYVNRWFTIGFEPKIAFGVNVYKAQVLADKIRSPGDPAVLTKATNEKFAPIGEFQVNGRVHVSRNFSLFVSYQILIAAGITRPHENIFYNDFGSTAPLTGIVVKPAFENMVIQGLSVGGELRFR